MNGLVREWKSALLVKGEAVLAMGTEYIRPMLKVVEMEKWWKGEGWERIIPQRVIE